MSSGPSFHTSRVPVLIALIAAIAGVTCQSAAQTLGSRRTRTAPAPTARLPKPLQASDAGSLSLGRISKEESQDWIRRTLASNESTGAFTAAAAPAPPATTPQFIDLTTNPRPPLVGPSTLSQEIHPMWSWDQQSIFFSSNNINPIANYGATAPPGNAPYHVYRMSSDGAFVAQVTGTTIPGEAGGNQFFPAINHSLTKLAYVHRDGPTQPFELYVLDLFTGQREQLTGISVNNSPVDSAALVNVEHPSWAPGDGLIAFAARNSNVTNDPLNVYVVDVVTKVVTKLTNGTPASGVECKDPIFHPNVSTARIAFAANTGNPAGGPGVNGATGDLIYRANPLQDLRGDGSANDVDHNIFTVPLNGPTPGNPTTQVTFSTADDIEPSYNQSLYPPGSSPSAGYFHTYLAFASLGRQGGRTYDIYFSDGNSENTTTNVPIRLFTPDTNAGAVPLNGSDERYPTWSASLPPQNPIDRIAFSSNRQNNTTDLAQPTVSATDTDIWAAEVTDITPPTLFSIDEQAGEIMHIANAALPNPGRRIGTPGDTFYFYAKVKDLQYGVESVWAQIKDPDGPGTDSQSTNHKLYGVGQYPGPRTNANNAYVTRAVGTDPWTPTHYLHLPWETDYEGIGVSDYQYFSSPRRFDYATGANAQFASFSAGVDDSVRWSGTGSSPYWSGIGTGSPYNPPAMSNRPPLDINGNPRWLRLHDDGNFPDLTAGDDIYSASWVSPQDASDFYVDLIAYDKAFNPRNVNEQQNWIIYDNIWGFSTQRFISNNPVLYVDDNGAGQKWPRGLKGSFRAFRTFRYGTESDIIERDPTYKPREVRGAAANNDTGPFTLLDVRDAGGGGLASNQLYDFLSGPTLGSDFIQWITGPALRAYRYDYWRILAKGPVTETVLDNYTPTRDEQPLNLQGTQTVQRPVPRRAVVWNAPYTGDIYAGVGSILDQATQTLLATYQSRAGRLMVAGGDIMWALTGGNPQNQHPFHQNILGADYVSDEGGNGANANFNFFGGGPIGQDITLDPSNRVFATTTGNPPWWGPADYDPDPLGTLTSWPDTGTNRRLGSGNVPWGAATDGTPFQTQDNLSARAGWETIYANRMVAQNNTTTGSKTVFLSASLASVGRRYGAQDDDVPLDCLNYKAKIAHAMFCWMFSADLVGQVKNLNGGAPISGAWVQAFVGNNLVGSAFSRADGTYTIRGLPIVQGGWNIAVTNPGFLGFNKSTGTTGHGLSQAQLDVLLSPAAPGSISGRTFDQDNQPVGGVNVHAVLQASPLYTGVRDFFAVSQPDGTYVIPSAPVGQYTVTLDQPLPPGFVSYTPQFTSPITVNQAQATTNINFQLQGGPADLTVKVFRQQPDGTKGAALPGVDVTLLDGTGAPMAGIATALTDSTGTVVFTSVPAGPATVSAFKTGFQEGTRAVAIPQQQTPVEILLVPATPQFVYGTAVRAIDGAELSASELNPPVTLQLLRRVSQLPIGATADVFSPASTTPSRHNYAFNTFEGSYTVALRNHPRFFDQQVNVVVTPQSPSTAPLLQLQGRDGILSGSVKESVTGGGTGPAVAGASVQLISQVVNPGATIATLTSGADGKWATTAAIASDLYTITISKFGYSSLTLTDVFVAGDTTLADALLIKAPRGQVYGLARRGAAGPARPNVKVEFWTPVGSPFGQFKVAETTTATGTTTAADGLPSNYVIGDVVQSAENLPAGSYQVRVTGDPRFAPFLGSVTVLGGQAVRFDLNLTPLGGVLTGLVKEDVVVGTGQVAGPPIANATVKIMLGASTVATLTTDSNGQYQTPAPLQAANYTVVASAFGYQTNSVDVFIEGPTSPPTTPDVLLERQPPATINGIISRRNTSPAENVDGVALELLDVNNGNAVVATSTSTAATSGVNYTINSVPAGTYAIRATKPGWVSFTTTSFTVVPNTLYRKDIQIDPQHTFGQGLLLVSLPQDFPGQDAAGILGSNSADFKSAYWRTDRQDYAYYHLGDQEAKEFRLGKAMFVRFTRATPFVKAGAPAPNAPFAIPVQPGWNMIGSVRTQRMEWLRVNVATPDGQVRTMQQAMNDRIVGNGLFTYIDRYTTSNWMDPFVGYFMKANESCTLIVPPTGAPSAVTPADRAKVARLPKPSLATVAAEIEAAGLSPAASERQTTAPLPEWAATAARFGQGAPVRALGTKSINNLFELWPWRPGLG